MHPTPYASYTLCILHIRKRTITLRPHIHTQEYIHTHAHTYTHTHTTYAYSSIHLDIHPTGVCVDMYRC